MGPYTREKIENWVSDFCSSDRIRDFSGGIREHAQQVLVSFLAASCQTRDIEPDEVEEQDVKTGLLGPTAKLAVPPSVRKEVPALCGAFLGDLQQQGRLGGGRMLGAYTTALKDAYLEAASGKPKPIARPGSRIGRNDPCPCGSGRKYKKCCMDKTG